MWFLLAQKGCEVNWVVVLGVGALIGIILFRTTPSYIDSPETIVEKDYSLENMQFVFEQIKYYFDFLDQANISMINRLYFLLSADIAFMTGLIKWETDYCIGLSQAHKPIVSTLFRISNAENFAYQSGWLLIIAYLLLALYIISLVQPQNSHA